MTEYYVPVSTTVVDGNTFYGGGKCTSSDTIIIIGGPRGGLQFKNFDVAGSYITITNENKLGLIGYIRLKDKK